MKEIFGRYSEGMKIGDLHVHTNVSVDTRNGGLDPEEVVELASETGLSIVAITDHHSIAGAEKARNYASKYESPTEVIVGIEVSTDKGHIIGLYVREPIQKTSLEDAIYQIHRQGGLVIVPHPFLRPIGLSEDSLREIINDPSNGLWFDGFELFSQGARDVFHARNGASVDSNRLALEFYKNYSRNLGAPISSSDSHGITIGRARTAYHGNFGKAIEENITVPMELSQEEQAEIYSLAKLKFGERNGTNSRLKNRLRQYYENQER